MMKKLISCFLIVTMLLAVAGCSNGQPQETTQPSVTVPATAPVPNHKVTSPMTMPDYSVPKDYTTDDLRAIAVQAMKDLVSIQWTPDKYYTYRNPFDLPDKQFQFVPEVTFAGLPYTNAHTGLFQWFAYYNPETGVMSYPGDGMAWSEALGTVCADAILWSWSTVANTMASKFYTFHMTVANGYVPVGGYKIPANLLDYRTHSTQKICEDNGRKVMLDAYAKMKPADALTSTPKGHALMVVSGPFVSSDADGYIDDEQSYVYVIDQGGGKGNHFYEVEVDGETQMFCGRLATKFTFATLYNSSYIPVTAKEFVGEDAYEVPEAKLSGSADSLTKLYSQTLSTNYILCNLELTLEKADGSTTRVALLQYNKAKSQGETGKAGFQYKLSDFKELKPEETLKNLGAVSGDSLKLTAQLAGGQIFELAKFSAI